MSAETALAILALAISMISLGVVLTLLFTKRLEYPSRKEHDDFGNHVTGELGRLQYSLSMLYRYVEVVDEYTGAQGYRVLGKGLRSDQPPPRKR